MANFLQQKIVASGNAAANITSQVADLTPYKTASIQLVILGSSPTGNAFVQTSLDLVNWANVSLVDHLGAPYQPAWAGANADVRIRLDGLGDPYLRVQYVATSGTGTMQGYIFAK